MRSVAILTGRNLRLFFRDRAGVFFSLLSALILIGLYALFLGGLQVDNLTEQLPNATEGDIQWFVNTWVFAGITMITTLTTALAALAVFVDDKASGRFSDFIVSPIRRPELILGYLLSSFVISFTMTLVIVAIGQLYLLIQGNALMTVEETATTIGYVAISALRSPRSQASSSPSCAVRARSPHCRRLSARSSASSQVRTFRPARSPTASST